MRGTGTLDALLLGIAALVVFLLLGPLLTIPLHIPLNYNEGWNAYLDQRAVDAGAGPLYPPPDGLVFNNYPPLSFYVVGLLGRYVVGDMIVAGRIVALVSLLASAALLGICVRLLGGGTRGSLAASGLLLLYGCTFSREYVAMDDPQWLGHALMLLGLQLLLRGGAAERYSAGRVAAAALLVTAGGFVKHNLVGLPLAVSLWLAIVRPRIAAMWLMAAIASVVAGLLATEMRHGHAAFADVLAHHRIFRAARVIAALQRLLPMVPMMLIVGLACRHRRSGDRPLLFASLFVATSLLTAIVQRLGEGVSSNAYFETMIASCLATGIVVSRAEAGEPVLARRALTPAALLGVAALPVLVIMPWRLTPAWGDVRDRAERARSWQPIIAQIARAPGLAGCRSLALCFWAGRPFEIDQFNLEQSVLTGGSIARFEALARTHAFGVFEYGWGSFAGAHWAETVRHDPLLLELVEHGYVSVIRPGRGVVLLVPRPEDAVVR